ncbi:MAG: VacJ family lipoprotein [Alphaproteobacteria bacterium]|nr:VacJ family lipoprotein [Alphaproteobacteria bacterium]
MNMLKKIFAVASVLFVSACAFDGKIHRPEAEADPFESINRPIFKFNQQFDKYLLKPAAEGYRAITTPFIRERVNSTLATTVEPVSAVNNLLQGEPVDAAVNVARFAINATLGLAGMFDVAEGWGLEPRRATVNETLAKWCIVDGPYIVLPFFGPSTPRSAIALATGAVMDPVFWSIYEDANVRNKVGFSYAALIAIAARENAMELLDDLERNSVDLYAATRSAYLQNLSKLRCFNDKSADSDAYDFDFGIDVEDDEFEKAGY